MFIIQNNLQPYHFTETPTNNYRPYWLNIRNQNLDTNIKHKRNYKDYIVFILFVAKNDAFRKVFNTCYSNKKNENYCHFIGLVFVSVKKLDTGIDKIINGIESELNLAYWFETYICQYII